MKNLVIKRKVNFILVLVSLIVVSFSNVFAGEYELLEPKATTLITPTNLDFVVDYIAQENEEEMLDVKVWMLNPEVFIDNSEEDLIWDDKDLNIEPWMLDVESFEEDIQLEAWMTDVNSFLEMNEPELAVKEWMLDVDSFLKNNSTTFALK